ncbi:hypothetical protein Sme01_15710 [Sphaerisporangium melleum]|uniref:DUF397 domain-containing protein n=1 Tax=Sphaerisporangium melleum TaxID=321316 RepID=A0A917RKK9_9ACTN|nr:DUF397 domain-containing protein [Sphaerisporangium melleum]GGL10837.1 hypothetical protein GCM10007964_61330 [Sphaerisporangium melleum]GII69095.1 hypothetical protein Sme01_15710 [Sphaerisporangium melleum]
MDELTQEPRTAKWIKSSHSGNNGGNCIEVARLSGAQRGVRDSKNPAGPVLLIPGPEWTTFIADMKTGEVSRSC